MKKKEVWLLLIGIIFLISLSVFVDAPGCIICGVDYACGVDDSVCPETYGATCCPNFPDPNCDISCGRCGTYDCTGTEAAERCGVNGQIGGIVKAFDCCLVNDDNRFYCAQDSQWYSCESPAGSWTWVDGGNLIGGQIRDSYCCDPSKAGTAKWSYCGDNNVNSVCGEECDDGNTNNGDGCSSTCQFEDECTSGVCCDTSSQPYTYRPTTYLCGAAWTCTDTTNTDNKYSIGYGYETQGYCDGANSCDRSGITYREPDGLQNTCECEATGTQGTCDNAETDCWDTSQAECCGDDSTAIDTWCAGGYTACYETIFRTNGDYNSYLCSCGGGDWAVGGEVSPTTCCGDDLGEYYKTNAGVDACCDNTNDCVDSGGTCRSGNEGTAYNNCNDNIDNSCDGEKDWDTLGLRGTEHGDINCPVGISSTTLSDYDILDNDKIDITCTLSTVVAGGLNSIFAYLDNNQNGIYDTGDYDFGWVDGTDGWSTDWSEVYFKQRVITGTGTKHIYCGVYSSPTEPFDRSYQTGIDAKAPDLTVISDPCTGLNRGQCNNAPECKYIDECRATAPEYSGGPTRCIKDEITVTYVCNVAICGEACDGSTGCSDTDCDPLDACYTGTYRDYTDIPNSCQADCSCTTNTCTTFTPIITDIDGDTYDTECDNDCDDNNPDINPGATEICDSIDNNCDGNIDEGFTDEECEYICETNSYTWTNNGGILNCCGNDANEDDPYELTETTCDDGNDNDCDGFIDNLDDNCPCTPGETKLCEKQEGVCVGSEQTCTGEGAWPGCDYSSIPDYEAAETLCDEKDNDCDGTIDENCEPDTDAAYCEVGSVGIQGNCASTGNTWCWDPYYTAAEGECCGDDKDINDKWVNTINNSCCEDSSGNYIFQTDADYSSCFCNEMGIKYEGSDKGACETTNEFFCWSASIQPRKYGRCCGDDKNEVWNYSSSYNIDNVLVKETCYSALWKKRSELDLIYYDLSADLT